MAREGSPFPSPSRAPERVTDTAETTKPRLITRRATAPMATVSGLAVNRPMSWAGMA